MTGLAGRWQSAATRWWWGDREDGPTSGVNSTPGEGVGDAGAAYVFTRSGGVWSQQAYLKPAAVGLTQLSDEFGWSVAISGDTIVVGAYGEASSTTGINSTPNELAPGAGAAYVFLRSGAGVWSQQAYLKPSAVGTTQSNDHFGYSVAVSGDRLVVGAPEEDSGSAGVNSSPNELAGGAGAAYVFGRNAGIWSQEAYLKAAVVGSQHAGDFFGGSVAISGDTVVVGDSGEDSSTTGINSRAEWRRERIGRGVRVHAQRRCVEPTGLHKTGCVRKLANL